MKTSYNSLAALLTILLCIPAIHSIAQMVTKDDCRYWLGKADTQITQGHYDSAFAYVNTSIKCYKATSNKKGEAEALTVLATIYEYRSDYVTSLQYYSEALHIYQELGEKEKEEFIKRVIALYYQRNKEYDKAKDYFVRHLENVKKKKNRIEIADAWSDLGLVYLESGKFDSAIYSLNEAYLLYNRTTDKYSLGIVTNNLGDSYRYKKLYKKAISSYKESLTICEEINDVEGSVWPMHNLAIVYTLQGNFAEAQKLLQTSRDIAERLKIPYLRKDNYLYSSQLDSARQNFNMAYQWFKLYYALNDSLSSAQNSALVHEMNLRFDSDRKDREIQFLNKEKQSYIGLLTISGLLIVSLLYLIIYRIRMQRNLNIQKSEVSKKIEELNQLHNDLEDLIREKAGLISIVAHDLRSPLQKTTGLLSLIKLTGPVNTEQEEMITMIQKACNDGNVLIEDLLELSTPESNSSGNLVTNRINVNEYLENLALQYQQRAAEKKIQIEVKSQLPESTTLDTNEEKLTRILDNLVSNAIKFSNPETKVLITVRSTDGHLIFSVKDEGPGIKEDEKIHLFKKFKKLSARPTAGESSTGLGLSIVKTLVEQLGGSISVESITGKGSTFIVVIPQR